MPQTATIKSLPAAFAMMRPCRPKAWNGGEDYRGGARHQRAQVVRAYARRAKDVDPMILACFLLGLSTRKVAIALLPILGRPVSPATISAVAKQLDAAGAAIHSTQELAFLRPATAASRDSATRHSGSRVPDSSPFLVASLVW